MIVWKRLFGQATQANRGQSSSRRRKPTRLSIEPLEPRCLLTALTVNSLDDNTIALDGQVTLREAIIAANDDSMTDLGQTGSGADEITFDPTLFSGGPQTLLLGGTELAITSELTIAGPGASSLAIDAQHDSRIFNIDDGGASQVAVEISGLTLTGGFVSGNGGAIFNAENLTLSNSTITGNTAGNWGGGVLNDSGTLTITESTISGNSANVLGGGVFNRSMLTITGSTVSGNDAHFSGGGVFNIGGILTVTGSAISGNYARSDHGGGVYNAGTLTVDDSVISGNSARNGFGGGVHNGVGAAAAITGSTINGHYANRGGGGV
ncbi:MAG: hypothetical protein N2C14_25220, partial [Planctomycetales bacterium]